MSPESERRSAVPGVRRKPGDEQRGVSPHRRRPGFSRHPIRMEDAQTRHPPRQCGDQAVPGPWKATGPGFCTTSPDRMEAPPLADSGVFPRAAEWLPPPGKRVSPLKNADRWWRGQPSGKPLVIAILGPKLLFSLGEGDTGNPEHRPTKRWPNAGIGGRIPCPKQIPIANLGFAPPIWEEWGVHHVGSPPGLHPRAPIMGFSCTKQLGFTGNVAHVHLTLRQVEVVHQPAQPQTSTASSHSTVTEGVPRRHVLAPVLLRSPFAPGAIFKKKFVRNHIVLTISSVAGTQNFG